jgi:hypothetical protein
VIRDGPRAGVQHGQQHGSAVRQTLPRTTSDIQAVCFPVPTGTDQLAVTPVEHYLEVSEQTCPAAAMAGTSTIVSRMAARAVTPSS